MNGYKFFAVMPDARKSKSASKQYPMQPWTRATMRDYAAADRYVECLAVELSDFVLHMESNGHNCVVVFRVPRRQSILVEKILMLRSS